MMPKLGEVVLFTFSKDDQDKIENHRDAAVLQSLGQSIKVPATVVAVWGEDCVNLRVHLDGPGPDIWETSVPRFDPTHERDGWYWDFNNVI